MKKNKKNCRCEKTFLAIALVFAAALFFASISFVSAEASFSQTNVQYFSPATTSLYNNLMSGPTGRGDAFGYYGKDKSTTYDAMFFIPPAGCQPYVIRSDLLEEQSVPVFCKIVPLKINPGVDITRIDSISINSKSQNPYISGVSFHPAKAAINSRAVGSSLTSGDSIGYIVVVLKKQPNENAMPNMVNATFSISMTYGADYAFGLGDNEFYLPVMSNSQFDLKKQDSSFFNGMGFIRAESVDENGAVISVYSSNGNKVFSNRIEIGKTSNDFYLDTPTGGQGMRITLQGLTSAETKATIKVNGRTFDVYQNGLFYDGKCRLLNLEAYTAGTGTAKINCGGKTIDLAKSFNKVDMQVQGKAGSFSIGEKIDSFKDTDATNPSDAYLVYTLKSLFGKEYALIAKVPKKVTLTASADAIKAALISATKKVDSALIGVTADKSIEAKLQELNKTGIINSAIGSFGLELVEGNGVGASSAFVINSLTASSNRPLGTQTDLYYKKALETYDYIKDTYGSEMDNQSYAEKALWASYNLAKNLGQDAKKNEYLSLLEQSYPNSKQGGLTAKQMLDNPGLLSTEGSYSYITEGDMYVELISVTNPSYEESNVNLNYNQESAKNLGKGSIIFLDENKSLTLASFDQNNVYIDFICKNSNGKTESGRFAGNNKYFTIPQCGSTIRINKITQTSVAHITLVPKTYGRSRETNISFAIGIEKRPSFLKPTPQEASDKIKELNKKIAQLRNITEKLGKVIEVGKAACLATSSIINIKNLLYGVSGEATARNEVTKRWNDLCANKQFQQSSGGATNVEQCVANNKNKIESEITIVAKVQSDYNTAYKTAYEASQKRNKGIANESEVKTEVYNNLARGINTQTFPLVDEAGKTVPSTDPARDILLPENLKYMTPSEMQNLIFEINMANKEGISEETKKAYQKSTYSDLKHIAARSELQIRTEESAKNAGISLGDLDTAITVKDSFGLEYTGKTWINFDKSFASVQSKPKDIGPNAKVSLRPYTAKYKVLYVLTDTLDINRTYLINNFDNSFNLIFSLNSKEAIATIPPSDGVDAAMLRSARFSAQQITSLKNSCKNCDHMKVFSLAPYAGMPALLPFDDREGWYVQVQQNFPAGFGNQKSYTDAGQTNSFYICNVGPNGQMEGININDDTCQMFNRYTGEISKFNGLSAEQTKIKVSAAMSAISSAQSQLAANPKITSIRISGVSQPLQVRSAEGSETGSKCTDFMSAGDCQLLFNVCDPFVCPNSRCDLGGKFKVDDVIGSGLVGSTVLCLPNFVGLPGNQNTGVVVPVCLTGIHAGIDGLAALYESYRDCLNDSITKNETVGICDEVYSAYFCDMIWRQAGPFTDAIFQNLFYTLFGQNGAADRGGAEYMFVQDSWNNAQKSSQYFTNNYAKNSKLAFGIKDLQSAIVANVCKMPVSATYPDKFKNMLAPDSPIQYTANFEEIPYTDATVPPKSQYKVFYHIYSGNDQGHYFQVYLKSPTATSGNFAFTGKDSVMVESGYVAKGARASKTKDFVDNSGFQQLCIRIDQTEKCGFKSVSTSFALNYAKDMAVKDQANNQVSTSKECVSGSASAGAFLTPNIQQGVEEFVNPEIYNQGITRVCANSNPGEPTETARWKDVGYCDNQKMRCWLDTNSVQKAIQGKGIENQTLSEIDALNKKALLDQGGYFNIEQGSEQITALMTNYTVIKDQIVKASTDTAGTSGGKTIGNLDKDVSDLEKRLIDIGQKVMLVWFKAQVYTEIANKLSEKEVANAPAANASTVPDASTAVGVTVEDNDTILLAKMIYGEARSESDEQMYAVGWVAMNRIGADDGSGVKFPATLRGVLEQKDKRGDMQFKGYNAALDYANLPAADKSAWDNSLKIATDIINKKVNNKYPQTVYFQHVALNSGITFAFECQNNKYTPTTVFVKFVPPMGGTKDLILSSKPC